MGPTRAYISHKNLAHNFELIKNAVSPSKIMGVVKADAYGHGVIECAVTLLQNDCEYLGVAFVEEGIELRKAGIQAPILVFGAHNGELLNTAVLHDLEITLTDFSQIKTLKNAAKAYHKRCRVHIKIDTGMNRIGFYPELFWEKADSIFKNEFIEVVGIYTHLSSADEDDLSYTYKQLAQFEEFKDKVKQAYPGNYLFHAANSATIMRLPESYFDMVRPGVMLYGNPPSPNFKLQWDLKEVMHFTSEISLLKPMEAGVAVSYNRRFTTKQSTTMGLAPVGYADGLNRKMTNNGSVFINGRLYPIRGTVCMDQFWVELGNDSGIQTGETVTLFGGNRHPKTSIVERSRALHTIPYEITCGVSARVPRVHEY
jgi:alanine racemase